MIKTYIQKATGIALEIILFITKPYIIWYFTQNIILYSIKPIGEIYKSVMINAPQND